MYRSSFESKSNLFLGRDATRFTYNFVYDRYVKLEGNTHTRKRHQTACNEGVKCTCSPWLLLGEDTKPSSFV